MKDKEMNVVCINRNNKDQYRFTSSPFSFCWFSKPRLMYYIGCFTQMYTKHPRTRYIVHVLHIWPVGKADVKEDFEVFKSRLDKMESASAQNCINIANQLNDWQKYSSYKESRKMIRLCKYLVKVQRKNSLQNKTKSIL